MQDRECIHGWLPFVIRDSCHLSDPKLRDFDDQRLKTRGDRWLWLCLLQMRERCCVI